MASREQSKEPIRVGLVSLGCAKNLVDAEIMLGALAQEGMEITNDASTADVVIINTCSFIDAAQEESVDTILESAQFRDAQGLDQAIVVSGCLAQRYREELPRLFPEVDAFMGIDQVTRAGGVVRKALTRRRTRGKGQARKPRSSSTAGVRQPATGDGSAGGVSRESKPSEPESVTVDVTARPTYIPDYGTAHFRLTPRHFAYLKIAEGCNHPCSFCIIPRMRGSHRSRSQADIVAEARRLIDAGVKELNLISQDSTYYGLDSRPNASRAISSPEKFRAAVADPPAEGATLCSLLRALNDLPGDFWIRLLYTHPAHWTDELVRTIAESPKVARYVDMPLQHIHDVMLERMRRETSRAYIEELIGRIRAGIPGIALRTTFIVGFPGETEAYFQSLIEFIRRTRFERLGVFTYSREDATVAGKMSGQVPKEKRIRRREAAMEAQQGVAREISASSVGRKIRVLVEKEATEADVNSAEVSSPEHGRTRDEDRGIDLADRKYVIARGEADAPDIDGRVYVREQLPLGEFATVRIVDHAAYDLIAEPV